MCNMPGMVEAKKSLEPLEHVNVNEKHEPDNDYQG